MGTSPHPGPFGPGGTDRMPAVNDVGEPCAGKPHARFDGRELETEQPRSRTRRRTPRWETPRPQRLRDLPPGIATAPAPDPTWSSQLILESRVDLSLGVG